MKKTICIINIFLLYILLLTTTSCVTFKDQYIATIEKTYLNLYPHIYHSYNRKMLWVGIIPVIIGDPDLSFELSQTYPRTRPTLTSWESNQYFYKTVDGKTPSITTVIYNKRLNTRAQITILMHPSDGWKKLYIIGNDNVYMQSQAFKKNLDNLQSEIISILKTQQEDLNDEAQYQRYLKSVESKNAAYLKQALTNVFNEWVAEQKSSSLNYGFSNSSGYNDYSKGSISGSSSTNNGLYNSASNITSDKTSVYYSKNLCLLYVSKTPEYSSNLSSSGPSESEIKNRQKKVLEDTSENWIKNKKSFGQIHYEPLTTNNTQTNHKNSTTTTQ